MSALPWTVSSAHRPILPGFTRVRARAAPGRPARETVGAEMPRRAMIRRRGKRGRIRRAEAAEAYEKSALLTNDAGSSQKTTWAQGMIRPDRTWLPLLATPYLWLKPAVRTA